jgi:galactokinase
VQARAVHVYSEASRVLRFRNICMGPDSTELKLVTLGGLMRKSQESLRERYECSCPELEELMVASKRLGAFGGRLTGAGWGGASVHLVRTANVRSPALGAPNLCAPNLGASNRRPDALRVRRCPASSRASKKSTTRGS